MRRTILACILALGLLATPLALADAGDHAAKGKEKAASAKAHRGNHTDDNATGGQPAWVAGFQARMRELRESWLENATKVREECRAAAKPADNATKEQRREWAHCIRDGYKGWLELLRAERKEARMMRDA